MELPKIKPEDWKAELCLIVCDNVKCAKNTMFNPNTDKIPYKRCSGCKRNYYCSIQCHKYSWRDGHKDACKSIHQECDYKKYISTTVTHMKSIYNSEILQYGVHAISDIYQPKVLAIVTKLSLVNKTVNEFKEKTIEQYCMIDIMNKCTNTLRLLMDTINKRSWKYAAIFQLRGFFIIYHYDP